MKRAIMIMLALTAAVSFSFADEGEQASTLEAPGKVVREATLRTGAPDFVVGKVDRVKLADLLTSARSKITIVDSSGNSNEFVVKALAVVYDSTGRVLTLNDVRTGQEVQVNYIIRDGNTREAVSIKILK